MTEEEYKSNEKEADPVKEPPLRLFQGGRKNFCVYREKSSLIRSRYV